MFILILKWGDFLETEKIEITERLRKNIIIMRKNKFLSSYELSSQSGHSKYWLPNIESGKTKKIKKSDLISIYKILCNTDDENEIIEYIEPLLNQQFGLEERNWYDLIKINNLYKDSFDKTDLEDALEDLLDEFYDEIREPFNEMSAQQKQAVLTALLNICYSFKKNPALAYTLINVPVYSINDKDQTEFTSALNELLALAAKYQDLADKNNIQTPERWISFNQQIDIMFQKSIQLAFNNFIDFIPKLYDAIESGSPDLVALSNELNIDVSFEIERGHPNVLKTALKHFKIYEGEDFAEHIKECVFFLSTYKIRYKLPDIYDKLNADQLDFILNYLKDYGDIRD